MKTITQGFLFSFQGGGKWSTPEGGYNGVDSVSREGRGVMFYLSVKDFDLK